MNELGILYRYLPTELDPPDDLWGRIKEVLDDAEPYAFDEINTLELAPPAAAWENIALALDELDKPKTNLSFADTCLAMDLQPPAFVWDEITRSLDGKSPVKKIGGQSKMKMVAIGLAIAACLTGIIFSVFYDYNNQSVTKNTGQLVKVNNAKAQQKDAPPVINRNDGQQAQKLINDQDNAASLKNSMAQPTFQDFTTDSVRELNVKKYNQASVPYINTTNNRVASLTGKMRDANGNIIDNIGNYETGSGYIAAIGPNGNPVNVSTKLAYMIPFFKEDSTAIENEEYLDKVMRESSVWRQKLIYWQKKVDAADANPSQINFLDPIDLLRFFEKNK